MSTRKKPPTWPTCKWLFGLKDATVEGIHRKVAGDVYRQGVDEVIADGRLAPEEQAFLKEVATKLRMRLDAEMRETVALREETAAHWQHREILESKVHGLEDEVARLLEVQSGLVGPHDECPDPGVTG